MKRQTKDRAAVLTAVSVAILVIWGTITGAVAASAAPSGPPQYLLDRMSLCHEDTLSAVTSSEKTFAKNECTLGQRDLDRWNAANPTPTPTPTVVPTTPPPTTTAPPTPTPTPTPTVTVPPAAYPNASNRGYPAGTTLTTNSSCTLQANTIYVAQKFTCRISAGNGASIINSWLVAGANTWNGGNPSTLSITDSLIGDPSKCVGGDPFALGTGNLTALRVKVVGYGDGLRSGSGNGTLTLTDSYVAPCRIPGGHGDGIQADDDQTGNYHGTVTLRHNTIDISALAFVVSNPAGGGDWTASVFFPVTGTLIADDNILRGGGYLFQVDGTANVITNNKLVDKSWEYGPSRTLCANTTWSNNVAVTLDGNGQPSTVLRTVACA